MTSSGDLCFATLFSGSSGNAVYIRDGESEILIDEGRSARCTEQALQSLGSSLSRISAIFVTHEHVDHTAGLAVTAKKYGVPIYLPAPCAQVLPVLPVSAHPMPPLFSMEVGGMTVRSFYTPHDSVMSVGYLVQTSDGRRLGVATDMGMLCREVVEVLLGCDAALIEANYDPAMLRDGSYPPALKERILSNRGHLPNDSSAVLAALLARSGTGKILLGHLSAENNTPRLAYDAAKSELRRRGVSAQIAVAERFSPTLLLGGGRGERDAAL